MGGRGGEAKSWHNWFFCFFWFLWFFWKIGILENWNFGKLEFWKIGILENWNFGNCLWGRGGLRQNSILSVAQKSIETQYTVLELRESGSIVYFQGN